ncbi:DUF4365 domain-containing protein [Paenibacillus taichungensis]|uniref:DUF4365 domain-containing protein n=1 Tax=Paenibacillus TaxID=44249 RepID=UPI0022A8E704|nr:DUF4365 domain-containing protein [Paenibacillus tundrae]MCZ1265965.1 DUF4365 domain-containing protein [Paenibacillus tundrae]
MEKKSRTRQHIIADISENFVERLVLLNSFSVESVRSDYGYDMAMFTYDEYGQIENGFVMIQLKATDTIRLVEDDRYISFPLLYKDLRLWLEEPMPVILILFDSKDEENHKAYWIYIQAYFSELKDFNLNDDKKTINVRFNVENTLAKQDIVKFSDYKQKVLSQIQGRITHEN